MFKFGRSKELIAKYSQLKYAKRTNTIWMSYINGMLIKAKQAMNSLPCLAESEYFQDSYRHAAKMLE